MSLNHNNTRVSLRVDLPETVKGPTWEREYAKDSIMNYFNYEHLPEKLQKVSKPLCELAKTMDHALPEGPEKSMGLRKLLEAKDCFVRGVL